MSFTWPVDRTCFPSLPADDDPTYATKVAQQSNAEDMAIQVLWQLSGRQFGLQDVTARPCPPREHHYRLGRTGDPADPYVPIFWGGRWTHYPCGCGIHCRHAGPRTVHLPGPVAQITSVTIGSDVLDEAGYVLEGEILYRKGANWPGQDRNRPLGEAGTWSVKYQLGLPVPPGVGTLTGLLAKEFIAACQNVACRLPRQVTNVTRQGVSYQVYDPNKIYAAGKTGLSEVDLWLASVNPRAIYGAPTVI